MNYFESTVYQEIKDNQLVCGDTVRCLRSDAGTLLILCDGVGSGIYANIAAITCAERLLELCSSSLAFKDACCTVADSMHRARTEDIPFAAFSALRVLRDGHYTLYTYESPQPILIRQGQAQVVEAERFLNAGYEIVGESFGELDQDDSLVLFSDGVSQAGLGTGYNFGIGSQGVATFLNRNANLPLETLMRKICQMTRKISGDRCKDDTTLAALTCREARQLTIATGPPASRSRDDAFVKRLLAAEGTKVVCGSTTADVVARQMGKELQYAPPSSSMNEPPEYHIDGIDLTTEGAIMLNQVYNILDEPPESVPESLGEQSPVTRLYNYIRRADVITFIHGRAMNYAHSDLVFKQLGVRPRHVTLGLLRDKLRAMGKLVITVQF